MLSSLIFFTFGLLAVFCGISVVGTKNPVHGVLYLILVFVNVMGMVMVLGLEFIGLVILLVYVGAVAVLFLFIVMMLNVKVVELAELRIKYLPLGFSVILLLLFEIFILYKDRKSFSYPNNLVDNLTDVYGVATLVEKELNIEVLGNLLYTYYIYYFMLAGLLLLLAMVGAICITYLGEVVDKKQSVYTQVTRDYKQSIVLKK